MTSFIKRVGSTLLALGLTLALFGAAVMPASALYNDQTRKYMPRQMPGQVVNYYRFTLNYNDPRINVAQLFGALPANAYVLSMDAYVTTAFNAGTTNVITIGATTAANEISASGTIAPATLGVQHLTTAAGLGLAVTGSNTYIVGATGGPIPPYVPLYVEYTQTGTAATAGQVTVVIAYVPNNDM